MRCVDTQFTIRAHFVEHLAELSKDTGATMEEVLHWCIADKARVTCGDCLHVTRGKGRIRDMLKEMEITS